MSDDVELERLLRELYAFPPAASREETEAGAAPTLSALELRSGLSDEQLRRLQDALDTTHAAPVENVTRRSPRRMSIRVGAVVIAAAAASAGVWLAAPQRTNETAAGGWSFEAQQQLRSVRGPTSRLTTQHPVYGPDSIVNLVFRRPKSGDSGVGDVVVFRRSSDTMIPVRAKIVVQTTRTEHIVTVRGRGQEVFGDRAGAVVLGFAFLPSGTTSVSLRATDVDSVRSRPDVHWREESFLYRMPSDTDALPTQP